MERQELIEKIEQVPPDRLAELERFVESILNRDDASGRTLLSDALTDYALEHAGTVADLPLTEEYRIVVREVVEDVLEEAGLIRAIDEGLKTNATTREEIFHILGNAQ
jgi:hypothetical protein